MACRARAALFLLLLAATGCGEDSAASSPGAGASGGAGGSGATGGAGGSTAGAAGSAPCSEDPSEIGPGAVCIHRVTGRVLDEARTPLGGLLTTVCGPVCFYGESDGSGAFSVDVGFHLALDVFSVLPHGRPDRIGFYFPLPTDAAGPAIDVGDLLLPRLPADGEVLVVKTDRAGSPAQSVTSGDVTLEVEQGVLVDLDVEDVAAGEIGKKFRTLTIAEADRAVFAPASLELVALHALAPFDASFRREADGTDATARLSFKNGAGLAPGAAVEVLALGSYLDLSWIKPARFEPVATARVTSDGARIELDAGQGIKRLTFIGLRPAK